MSSPAPESTIRLDPEVVTPNAAKARGRRAKNPKLERRNLMRGKSAVTFRVFILLAGGL